MLGLFLFASNSLSASDKLKIAVLDFKTVGDSAGLGEGAAEILRTTLIETGKYIIIERGMLKQILEEQKLNLSGIIDPKEAVGIGKILGAKLVAVGSVVKLGESYTLNIRFVNVESGEVTSGKKLTAGSKEEIPALCGQIVKLLAAGKTSAAEEKSPISAHKEEPVKPYTSTPPGKWSIGLIYPGLSIKYRTGKHAWEMKAQSGSGILAAGPRYYRYVKNSGLSLFWGLETDFISFKGDESKGSGFAAGGFAGGEISLGNNLSLSMDCGPMYLSLSDAKFSESASSLEYVLNMGIYWYFK